MFKFEHLLQTISVNVRIVVVGEKAEAEESLEMTVSICVKVQSKFLKSRFLVIKRCQQKIPSLARLRGRTVLSGRRVGRRLSQAAASSVQPQLLGAHENAVLGLAAKVGDAVHRAVVLSLRSVLWNDRKQWFSSRSTTESVTNLTNQHHARPEAGSKVRRAYESHDARFPLWHGSYALSHDQPVGQRRSLPLRTCYRAC